MKILIIFAFPCQKRLCNFYIWERNLYMELIANHIGVHRLEFDGINYY